MNGLILKNGIIITPFKKNPGRVLFVKNGKIEKIIHNDEFNYYPDDYTRKYKTVDVRGNFISPGFIDIHTHGANNIDAVLGPYEPMAEFKVKHGTTGFLPTFWNAEFDELVDACKKISKYMKSQGKGSNVLGINSEGPYLNPELGAQKKERAVIPVFEDYSRMVEASEGNLKIMTVSPEVKNYDELVKYLRLNDVMVAICYSNVSIKKLRRALTQGLTHIDHIFDCGTEPAVKEKGTKALGIEEELLVCDDLMAEVIADSGGVHVAPTWLKILVRCKGIENVILISDSRDIAGNPPGKYMMKDGFTAVIKKGEDTVRLENGNLAGCVMTMDGAIRNMIKHTGIKLEESIRMATYNPAKVIKISNRKGEIKEGMDADLAVFDNDINVKMAIVEGDIRYSDL